MDGGFHADRRPLERCLVNCILKYKIKLTTMPVPEDMERLRRTADLIGASRRFLVSKTAVVAGHDRCLFCNLPALNEHLTQATA